MTKSNFFSGFVIGLAILSLIVAAQHSIEKGVFIMMFVVGLLLLKVVDFLIEIKNKRS